MDARIPPSVEEQLAKFANATVEQIDAQLAHFDQVDYEDSLYGFLKAAWHTIDPAPWVDGWAIEAIAEHLQAVVDGEIRRLLINLPPRMGKSSIVSVALPAWCWAQPEQRHGPNAGPQVQFMHASYAEKLSLRDSVKCRRLIQSPWYQRHWGARFRLSSDQNVKSRFSNDRGGERLITSIGGATTGEGCDIGVIDDANSASEAFSEAVIQSTNDWWDQVMQTRLNNPKTGAFIGVQQRLAEDDWTGHILSKDRGDYVHLCYDDQTEVLTRRGWVPFAKLDDGEDVMGVKPETLEAQWETPTRYIRERHRGEMIVYKSQTADLMVTRDHRMVYGDPNDAKGSYPTHWRVRHASDLPTNFLLPQVVKWGGIDVPIWFGRRMWDPMAFAEFMGWYLSEGCASAKRHTTRIVQMATGPHVADIERVLASIPFRTITGMNNARMRVWQLSDRHLAEELAPLGKSLTKRAPAILKEMAPQYLQAFLIAYAKGDGHFAVRNARKITLASGSREMADDLHECAVKAGWAASLSSCVNKGRMFNGYMMPERRIYKVYLRASKAAGRERKCASQIRPYHTSRVPYDGMVYCVSVPSTALVVRRNGRVAISGNCLPMRYEPERSFVTSIGWKDPRTIPGELLMPERFGEAEVANLEASMGPWASSGQLQQNPKPKGGGIIQREWWGLWEADKFPPMDFVLASLDTAYTEKQENDPSAITVWGVFHGSAGMQANRLLGPDGKPMEVYRAYLDGPPKVVMMYAWAKRLELHELVTEVAKTCRMFGVDKLVIESKASGHSVAQEIRRVYGNEEWSTQLLDPKSQDKMARLYSVQHLFSEGMIYAPDRKWADEVISEIEFFPRGKHDDRVDTVSQALRHLRDMGLLTRSQERLEEIESLKHYAGRPPEPLYPG